MMERSALLGGGLRMRRVRRRGFSDQIGGNMFAILWGRSSWDTSLGERKRKQRGYEQFMERVFLSELVVILYNGNVYRSKWPYNCIYVPLRGEGSFDDSFPDDHPPTLSHTPSSCSHVRTNVFHSSGILRILV